ncbi:MAG: hypothetical protein COV36_04815 [Alphaproteobacteria bacterium CG11_big_fil_rev_8_21_14_0_20_44_7]|nr:MAG: hypothetical protein COV36_04815 [Alphaproteobacteria bacterium CG11_big_fil_rev_8_21_14_0_20_44_7]
MLAGKLKNWAIPALLAITACDSMPDWMGAGEEAKLAGDRYSVMSIDSKLTPDPSVQAEPVNMPPQEKELEYPNNGNYYIQDSLSNIRTTSIGSSSEEYFFITSQPLGANDSIITIDGSNTVKATDLNLNNLWSQEIKTPDGKEGLPGGGLAAENGILYITTGFGAVIAANLADGSEIWRKELGMPIRNAPIVSARKVFVSTNDNRLFALDAETGDTLWRHTGASEVTQIFGAAKPAIKNSVLVAAYSSGEVFGVNSELGRELWTELLSLGSDRTKASSGLTDITASPLIVDGITYITSHSGNLAALNLVNGFRIWEQPIGSGTTPWAAGRFLFIVTTDGELVALNRFDGRIKWVTTLRNSDEYSVFSGPIIAGDKILITDSAGYLIVTNPENGEITKRIEIEQDVYMPPIVYKGSVYLLSNNANLIQIN